MTYKIAPHFVRPWTLKGMTAAPLFRHPRRRRSIGTWLHVVMDSLMESYMTHATYCRLVKRGMDPGKAIRASFDLDRELRDPAGITPMNGAAQREERQDQ